MKIKCFIVALAVSSMTAETLKINSITPQQDDLPEPLMMTETENEVDVDADADVGADNQQFMKMMRQYG